jgi:hypothetical protein
MEVGMADRKTWWRNFDAAHPVRLRLAGKDYVGMAHVVRDGESVCVKADVERTLPRGTG